MPISPEEYAIRNRKGSTPELYLDEIEKRRQKHEYDCIRCLRVKCGLKKTTACTVRYQLNKQTELIERAMENPE